MTGSLWGQSAGAAGHLYLRSLEGLTGMVKELVKGKIESEGDV